MVLEIDFESDEAFYMQLRNQVIMGIATRQLHEGDTLPSVRQLADTVGINMHTVNKAYSMLREEGFLTLSKRTGAVIALDADRIVLYHLPAQEDDTCHYWMIGMQAVERFTGTYGEEVEIAEHMAWIDAQVERT